MAYFLSRWLPSTGLSTSDKRCHFLPNSIDLKLKNESLVTKNSSLEQPVDRLAAAFGDLDRPVFANEEGGFVDSA